MVKSERTTDFKIEGKGELTITDTGFDFKDDKGTKNISFSKLRDMFSGKNVSFVFKQQRKETL
ncbi:hypothetical protein BJV85_002861 [Clostridium acetobutylicum]|uniref:Uncharacterized protein n=1 Tax=Clostridium acetobutylicum (strain ATCC 824 / DSM 792 / JCM 1419 / IAM 19013 / LMG 5710 / NBRC 13948 / NRRL B-527 / VKM B-1787 / 2291 / W) TaxID=272562 RepID=Q97JY5_CLOAB|nr:MULTISPECIES: hypothetical protein [Clostridium]AAK79110.1 Hypothetical protein CA_C1137 [Clostridium acetobutylicum ATCC 824]ADZ20186.1 Conserved hypothetical protein [Clostridium acetobutylicum EA 2018]AEI31646.1 hypothetical protein SMB_G1156 [Clostridium acetobutylicum DSM 1731]AWV81636.1 hypothetical protein DK921_16370 [Clostridium acetobutylicum]MBC2393282.1 hypothetical protein [Clostridium acetobutylicum]